MLFQHAFNIHYRFQHAFSTCITDFNMHYRFQHVLKFSTCFFKMFSTHFKHEIHLWYQPCWKLCWKPCQRFQSVFKTMSKISKCVENHRDVMLHDPFHQFWNIIALLKIKSDIINEDYRSLWCYMWSVIEILCGLEEKIGPVCMQLVHNVHATEKFWIQRCCELSLFSFKLSKFVSIFSGIRKLEHLKEIHAFGTAIWCLGDE